MTVQELVTRALRYSDTNDTQAGIDAVNDALRDLHREAWSVTVTTVTVATSTTSYDLTTDFLLASVFQILQVEYVQTGSTYRRVLQPMTVEEVRNLQDGTVGGVIRGFAIEGEDTFLPFPKPNVGDQLTFRYLLNPTTYTTSTLSSTPAEVPATWHRTVAYAAAAELALAEGSDKAAALEAKFGRSRSEYVAWLARRKNTHPRRISAGYPDRMRRVYPDRAQDDGR